MRTHKQCETIGEFVVQLRKLSEHCGLGDSLPSMLRDRLVCGCSDHTLQYKLLAEENLTFDKALKIAKAVETAERDSRGMQDSSSKGPNPVIHAVSTRRPNQMKKVPLQLDTCCHCGRIRNAASCKV